MRFCLIVLACLSISGCAMTATPPKGVGADFDEAELDYYRRGLANGLSPEASVAWVKSVEGLGYVHNQRQFNRAVACYGSRFQIPSDIKERFHAATKGDTPLDGKFDGVLTEFTCPTAT